MAEIQQNSTLSNCVDSLSAMRRAIDGAKAVKDSGYVDLPHPSSLDKTSTEQIQRYQEYQKGAEFLEFPGHTLRTMLGMMNIDGADVELNSSLDYLISDSDGNGVDLTDSMQCTASEVLQVKWQILVAEYNGLQGVDTKKLSVAEFAQINAKANIKAYSRESVIDYHFQHANGVYQLVYIALDNGSRVMNMNTRELEDVKSVLILALDSDGNYYQQKIVDGEEGEKISVTVDQKPLKWLPVVIASDEPLSSHLPAQLGYMSPIVDLAYHRYNSSAQYKESMWRLPPTTMVKGAKKGDAEIFKEMNGRERIVMGTSNVLPKGYDVEVIAAGVSLEGYERYLESNKKDVRAVGGIFQGDETIEKTASQSRIESQQMVAKAITVIDSVESAYIRCIAYCGMLMGTYKPMDIESNFEDVKININRDFAQPKLTPEEVMQYRGMRVESAIGDAEFVKIMKSGGWFMSEVEQLVEDMKIASPQLVA